VSDVEHDVGTCDLCGQKLIRTATDCWHPWNVERACPPEFPLSPEHPNGIAFGDGYGRPGREHFVSPVTTDDPASEDFFVADEPIEDVRRAIAEGDPFETQPEGAS
jgi:hypothetical protein